MSFNVEEEWCKIDEFWYIYRYPKNVMKPKNLGTFRTGFSKSLSKVLRLLSVTPSTSGINTWSTSQIDFSTHSWYMDKPSWYPTNWEKDENNLLLERICNNLCPF